MCHHIKVLKQTTTGTLMQCANCDCYQLLFGNFMFEFTTEELGLFSIYVSEIDPAYWEDSSCNSALSRKIPIATLQGNLVLLINRVELKELRQLVFFKTSTAFELLSPSEINYINSLN